MRLQRILLIGAAAATASCTPLPSPNGDSDILPRVQTGAIVSLSLAGIIGAAIGLTEYASTLYHRLAQRKIEQENVAFKQHFNRVRKMTDIEVQAEGTDVVLDLVEKFLRRNETEEVELESTLAGDDEIMGHDNEFSARDIDERPPMPMPRLPGHPPLSNLIAQRY
jgi:hypothetical protein